MAARRFNVWWLQLCLSLLALLILSACNAVSVPTTTPEATRRALTAATPSPPTASPLPDEPTPTPFIWPTLPPSPTPVCPDAPRTRLIVQERGRVLPDDPRPVNVREGPGTDRPVKAIMPVLSVFMVLEGPVCNGGYSWFRIRYEAVEGWIAEGDRTSYYVEPYLPG